MSVLQYCKPDFFVRRQGDTSTLEYLQEYLERQSQELGDSSQVIAAQQRFLVRHRALGRRHNLITFPQFCPVLCNYCNPVMQEILSDALAVLNWRLCDLAKIQDILGCSRCERQHKKELNLLFILDSRQQMVSKIKIFVF
ncbi:uncharacterized protein LJ206_009112 [Theristicus caerulescens]